MSEKLEGNLPPQEHRENLGFNLETYFDALYKKMNVKIGTNELGQMFKEAGQELSGIFQRLTNNPEITVELSSDDPQELYDLDWHYPPFLEVFNGPRHEERRVEKIKKPDGSEYDRTTIKVINQIGKVGTNEELVKFLEQNKLSKK